MSQWSQPWFTCSQASPAGACGNDLIQISPSQTGSQVRIQNNFAGIFNRDNHIGKVPYIKPALPQAVCYLLGFFVCLLFVCFLSKGGSALISCQDTSFKCSSHSSSRKLCHTTLAPATLLTHLSPCVKASTCSSFCWSWQAFADTGTLCCLSRKHLRRTCQSLLWNSKQQKRLMGYCLMQGPDFYSHWWCLLGYF